MTHFERVRTKHGIAMALAPSLQRYDFSDAERQLKEWADLSYRAAETFLATIQPEMDAAVAKDAAELKAKKDAAIAEHKAAQASPAVQAIVEQSKEGEPT